MNDIITKNPSKLNNFTNLGYQTYLIAQEELDLMDKLFFDSFRLGEVLNDLKITEPVFREADIAKMKENIEENHAKRNPKADALEFAKFLQKL